MHILVIFIILLLGAVVAVVSGAYGTALVLVGVAFAMPTGKPGSPERRFR